VKRGEEETVARADDSTELPLQRPVAVFWNGELVGHIDGGVDTHHWGRWVPRGGPVSSVFESAVTAAMGDRCGSVDVAVDFGGAGGMRDGEAWSLAAGVLKIMGMTLPPVSAMRRHAEH
jgi:hypothetical protein